MINMFLIKTSKSFFFFTSTAVNPCLSYLICITDFYSCFLLASFVFDLQLCILFPFIISNLANDFELLIILLSNVLVIPESFWSPLGLRLCSLFTSYMILNKLIVPLCFSFLI